MGRPRGHRAPRPARPLRPLHLHGRLQHHHQPPAVRLHRPELADGVPLPRPDLPRHAGPLGGRPRLRPAPREGRDGRPHRHLAARHPGAVLRRPLHLGLAQRGQPAEGAALPAGVGRRAAAHAPARGGVPPARPWLPRHGSRPGPPGPHRHGGPPRFPGRPDPGRHERGRAAGRRHPRRARPGRPGGPALPPTGLRRARVHRPHGVAPVRRLVGRQSRHLAAGPRARPGHRAGGAGGRPRRPGRSGPRAAGPGGRRARNPSRRRRKGRCGWPATWPNTPGWPGPTTRACSGRASRSSPPGPPGPPPPWRGASSPGPPTNRRRPRTPIHTDVSRPRSTRVAGRAAISNFFAGFASVGAWTRR